MSTFHLMTVSASVQTAPVPDADGVHVFWADANVPAGTNGSNVYHFLMHSNTSGDPKRAQQLVEKYQVGRRFLFQGRFLFDKETGSPILREDATDPSNIVNYAAYDLMVNSGLYLGPADSSLGDIVNGVFIARVTKDPEMKYLPAGTALYQMNTVVDRSVKNDAAQGGFDNFPLWMKVTVWGEENALMLSGRNYKKGNILVFEAYPSADKEKTGFIKPFWGKIKDLDANRKPTGTEHEGWRSSMELWGNGFSFKLIEKGGNGGAGRPAAESDDIPF